jgi:ATP-dependent DNA helicase RecG
MPTDSTHPTDELPARLVTLPGPDRAALAATAVALANTDGGTLLIHTDDPGAVAVAVRAAAVRITPAIAFGPPAPVETAQGPACAVAVPRGSGVHALEDGRVLARTTFGNRTLNGDEIRALISERAAGEFEAKAVPGAHISDLDPALVAAFMQANAARRGARWDGRDLPLGELGALTPDFGVTVAGMLLFGRDPARWLPASGIRFARYVGRHRDPVQRAFERTLDGPLVRVFDRLWTDLHAQMRSLESSDEPDYPAPVLREVLVNAVQHRDYRLRGDPVRVELFADRLEITSPGGLPAFMSAATLLEGRYSRNPRLSRVLALWGYTAGRGGGVLRAIEGMDRRGCRPPEIESGPYRVTVRLYNAGNACADDSAPDPGALNEQQRAALAYVAQRGSLTAHEFRALFPALTSNTLERDLAALADSGHLRRVGARTGAYYVLP